jgi:DNA-binding transcriptional LysR family regulator
VSDLRRLRYFLAVARERNFTRAAEQLHVAQPALSRQVRLLERELGVELLHRTTHSFELTEAGRALLERGPIVLASFEELWHTIRSYGAGEQGAIALAYGASASYETAPRLLNALTERHTGLRLATEVKSVNEIVRGLADGSLDVGIVRCPPTAPDLESRSVRQEVQGVLVHRGHRLASCSSVTLEDLASEVLLMHPRDANPGHYDEIVGLCRSAGFEPRVMLRRLTFDLAYSPVASGDAIAIIGASSRDGLPDGLCWLALEPPPTVDVSLLTRRYNRSPAVERMLDSAELIGREFGWI